MYLGPLCHLASGGTCQSGWSPSPHPFWLSTWTQTWLLGTQHYRKHTHSIRLQTHTHTHHFRVSPIDDDTRAVGNGGHLTGGARQWGGAWRREAWPGESVQRERVDIVVVDKIPERGGEKRELKGLTHLWAYEVIKLQLYDLLLKG